MKKSLFRWFFMLMCICTTSLTLSSCSEDGDSESSPIVGTWVERFDAGSFYQVTTFSFQETGKGSKIERIESYNGTGISQDPINFAYVYKEDGTIRMTFDNDATLYTGTADITGNTLILRIQDTYYSLTRR